MLSFFWRAVREGLLHLAASAGHEKVVAILLAHKPSPLLCMFFTPLHGAAKKGHEGVVAQLLVHTPNLTLVRCPRGYTPIHSAVRKRHEAVVAHSPNSIDIPLDSDWTVLHTAVNVGNVALVALLLAHRPEMALARTNFGKLPLHGLMEYGGNKNEIAHLVLAVAPQLAGPISTDEKENTLLHQVVALNCNVNVVAKVWRLNLQASQARNLDDQTPFHMAAKRKFGEVAELLQWQVPICDIVSVVKWGLPSFRLTLSKVCEPLLVRFTQDLRSIVFEYLGLIHNARILFSSLLSRR